MRAFLLVAMCVVAGCAGPKRTAADDHAVYTSVLLQQLKAPRGGEHSMACEPEEAGGPLLVVSTTQPLPPGTLKRDGGWIDLLPKPAAPLFETLRALDTEPPRTIDAALLTAGVPIQLVPEAAAAASGSGPPLHWFSRVAYTPDGKWALVYAVKLCPGVTEAMKADAEPGAYQSVFLAALEWRDDAWRIDDPLYLDVGPRLDGKSSPGGANGGAR